MIKRKPFLITGGLICILLLIVGNGLMAQNAPLEFKHRDRIVFLGGSLFENELTRGYLELAMTTRFPDRDLTFRNLGWTGDNVFAEARSTFTTPPTPYQQLFQQIRSTNPNYVLISYGAIESQKGQEGLAEFTRGLEVIIDSVDALGAESILLSTIPVRMAGTPENTQLQNRNLKTYADAIAGIAKKRNKRFVDLYTPISQRTDDIYLDNGIHLNDYGYYHLAQVLEESFGWSARKSLVQINTSKNGANASSPAKIVSEKDGKIVFSFKENILPLPVPAPDKTNPEASVVMQFSGLKKGYYTLTENGRQLLTASAADWEKGIPLNNGISQVQAGKLSEYIAKKNDLFFQQYRPLNRTYILGFRSYEQGRHKQGLKDLDFIIVWLEGQVNLHRTPTVKVYELIPLK